MGRGKGKVMGKGKVTGTGRMMGRGRVMDKWCAMVRRLRMMITVCDCVCV